MDSLNQPISAHVATARSTTAPAGESFEGWYETTPDRATMIAVVELTIPGVFDKHVEQFTLAHHAKADPLTEGAAQLPTIEGISCACGDGSNEKGDVAVTGGAYLARSDEDEEDSLIVHFNYEWTTAAKTAGSLTDDVPVRVGAAKEARLASAAQARVTWKKVAPAKS